MILDKTVAWQFALTLFFLLQPSLSQGDSGYLLVKQHLHEARTKTDFVFPSKKELQTVQHLFYRMLKKEPHKALIEEWKQLNFSMTNIECKGKEYTLLSEDEQNRTGRGFYIFPTTPKTNRVLMIPHGLHDFHTDDIGIQLSLEGHFAAAAFNTVHRYGNKRKNSLPQKNNLQQKNRPKNDEAHDLAKLSDTFFTAFTAAFARAYPDGSLLQVHGFSKSRRKTLEGRNSNLVVSSGTRQASRLANKFADCLKKQFTGNVSLYPRDVRELGGTRNISGILLRSAGHNGFIHIELDLATRQQIKDVPEIKQWFLNCIEML
ncbi:hypothetical protein [Desulfobacula phenolica]|uniref:N-formylglutamate amidohydrolase n=1 Tax=Desulfobacula phenolica TaxID=90732 RepID=A0A1H2JHH6_9BACT|nr:hypothetical protein [Desulfobacula phenolica]SDU55797.1 hypothetical protein SAMN04487931_11293 [Desulfobacula phenolica]